MYIYSPESVKRFIIAAPKWVVGWRFREFLVDEERVAQTYPRDRVDMTPTVMVAILVLKERGYFGLGRDTAEHLKNQDRIPVELQQYSLLFFGDIGIKGRVSDVPKLVYEKEEERWVLSEAFPEDHLVWGRHLAVIRI